MSCIIVAGIGTGVGKTVVSAILTTMLNGNYWKPFQTGIENTDSQEVARLVDPSRHQIFPPAYSLEAPVSPHYAARLEGVEIDVPRVSPPRSKSPLVIEGVGGIYVPLSLETLSIDLFQSWDAQWILVSKHYLGSINHTLLTIDALKTRGISPSGIVFNGKEHPDTEEAILKKGDVPFFGRLLPEPDINPLTIQRYAKQWQH
jgi:dethiobiotin synthetase